jgi:glycosyltransferase involved in cell wall biosynthesis
MRGEPVLTVIIPVWNGEDRIGLCLDALGKQTVPAGRFEVIVVDNGSTDRSAEIARSFPFVTVVAEPIASSYRARNTGLQHARCEYVLFTDADCVPQPNWIEQALLAIGRYPDVGGRVTLFREDRSGRACSDYEELFSFNQRENIRYGLCITANWLCLRSTLMEVGGFNPDLLSGGDAECSRRIAASGKDLVYVDEMVVRHPTRANIGELIRKRRRVVGGRWRAEPENSGNWRKLARQFHYEAHGQAKTVLASSTTTAGKLGVTSVIAALLLVSQLELLRVAAGGQPYRS